MIIKINKTIYRIDHTLAASSKKVIRTILNNVKVESKLHGIDKYYTAFVVMMYIISSSILTELGTDALNDIVEKIDKQPNVP